MEYIRLLAEAGLTVRPRAPMLLPIKLAFGPAYDKTRLTEYATVLAHAERQDMAPGSVAGWLAAAPAGVTGVLKDERLARTSGAGRTPRQTRHDRLAERLRRVHTRPLDSLDAEGPEFAVVLTRRLPTGEVVVLGEASADETLLARMARHLPG